MEGNKNTINNVEQLSKTNLYIRGLQSNTTDQDLYNMCRNFGQISSTKAILEKDGACKGYGFVEYTEPKAAELAVQELTKSGIQAQMAKISPVYSANNHNHHHNYHNFHHHHHHHSQHHQNQHHYQNNHHNLNNNNNNTKNRSDQTNATTSSSSSSNSHGNENTNTNTNTTKNDNNITDTNTNAKKNINTSTNTTTNSNNANNTNADNNSDHNDHNNSSSTDANSSNFGNNNSNHGSNASNSNIHPTSNNSQNADYTNLYIANLPPNMSEEELENLLSNYGPVVSTRILRDQSNNPRGVGFARMETRDKCEQIIEQLNGKPYKGWKEPLLVKFADGSNKKRHHNSHQHQHHHHSHNTNQNQHQNQHGAHQHHYNNHHQHHKNHHQDDNRWRDNSFPSDFYNVSGFYHQGNMSHSNHLTDLSMMNTLAYPRIQPGFATNVPTGGGYPASLVPPTSAPQWIHSGNPGQAYVISQQMIQAGALGPSNHAAAAAAMHFGPVSHLNSQMQGLHLTHGRPVGGYLAAPPHHHQWSGIWPHPVPPHQVQSPLRPPLPIQQDVASQDMVSPPGSQQTTSPQPSTITNASPQPSSSPSQITTTNGLTDSLKCDTSTTAASTTASTNKSAPPPTTQSQAESQSTSPAAPPAASSSQAASVMQEGNRIINY